jgi:hypothetical protein
MRKAVPFDLKLDESSRHVGEIDNRLELSHRHEPREKVSAVEGLKPELGAELRSGTDFSNTNFKRGANPFSRAM